eukprot:scaffold86_cov338-Pavlova_lutheri.AAC.125
MHVGRCTRLLRVGYCASRPASRTRKVQAASGEIQGEAEVGFESLELAPVLVERLRNLGFRKPTAIQTKGVPAVLSGANCALKCYTGSGKTLAYLLPMIHSLLVEAERFPNARPEGPRAIVITPSRELAMQIVRQAQALLGSEYRSLVQQCIGGANTNRQEDALRRNAPLVVVGTPGRLAELSRAGSLRTHQTRLLVVDEADELLEPNFRIDMERLAQQVGRRVEGGKQTILVSATLTPASIVKMRNWCSDPLYIDAEELKTSTSGKETKLSMPPTLKHYFVTSPRQHKVDMLRRAVNALGVEKALVFMNFSRRLKDTAAKLEVRGYAVGILSGEMDKVERKRVLNFFNTGKIQILLVSDVAARGIDVPDCQLVVSLELPSDAKSYVHRAGRTARAGVEGYNLTIVEPKEKFVVEKFAEELAVDIEEIEIKEGRAKLATP